MKNTLQTLQKKRKSKKGFTLMEMLIVVAIIAILVAIAIPVFSAQMDNAKKQVDAANLRSATSMAVVSYLTTDPAPTGELTYIALEDEEHTMVIKQGTATEGTEKYYPAQKETGHIVVKVTTGGKVTEAKWGTS